MIYINENCRNGYFYKILSSKGISFKLIDSERDIEKEIKEENKDIYICKDSYLKLHKCPGTKHYRCCNYFVFDLVEGCPFDCTYCVLQALVKHPYIRVNDNIDQLISSVNRLHKKGYYRIGTGELSDSLALDYLLNITSLIIPKLNKLDNILFEFKTKSNCINNLLNLNPKNIIVSWSLNPVEIITKEEHKTASLDERLTAAKKCSEAGYKIALHFDPLIYCNDFEKKYKVLIKKVIDELDETNVLYISLSTLRFLPEIVDMIRMKFVNNNLLSSSFIHSLDGKLRYFKPLRKYMLNFVYNTFREYWKKVFIYFCMEDRILWENIIGFDPGKRSKFENYFMGGFRCAHS
jgi:spore photoproduct lyase